MSSFDVMPFIGLVEGQHFERKSLFEGEPGRKKPRDRRAVRDNVAEYVAAFANAEGGVLILGIEDDGAITGHNYPADAVEEILKVPRTRLEPALPEGLRVSFQSVELLVFDVAASDAPVMVTGNGYPLRMGDHTLATHVEKIRALKFQGLAESWESRPSSMSVSELDPDLIDAAKRAAGHSAWTTDEYLLARKLADRRGQQLALRKAAELVFARHGPDHPNAGVRVFRVIGTERRLGAEHNVQELPRIEGPVPSVLQQAFSIIGGLLRRPSRLVGTRFKETTEYPDFAWREALLNAVAHRDYAVQGRATEVFLFDDRMEVTSPGSLVSDVTLVSLVSLERVHHSRNPRTVRCLVDLGYMRDQGEGIPRLFAEMEGHFLPTPVLETPAGAFRVTLRNAPTLSAADKAFVAALGDEDLSDVEFRALLEASRHGKVENAEMRRIAGLDTLGASALLRRLRDRGLLRLHAAGARSYFELTAAVRDKAGVARDKEGVAADKGGVTEFPGGHENQGRTGVEGGAADDKGGVEAPHVPSELLAAIAALGPRPDKRNLHPVIVKVCALGWWTPKALALVFGKRDAERFSGKHLVPLAKNGVLRRRYPDNETHPHQAYTASSGPLFDRAHGGRP